MAEARGGQDPAPTTWLITPTAGAGRQVTECLKAAGQTPPACLQPMQALLPAATALASPVERSLAWSDALQSASRSLLRTLF